MPLVPLDLLGPGESARIVDIDGNESLVTRLHEMGLRPNTSIRMVQPGEPCIIAIDNQRLSFRGEDSSSILVDTDA